MKLSIALNKPKAAKPQPASIQKPSAFSLGEDDEQDEVAPMPTAGSKAGPSVPSRSMKKKMEAEKQVDATVYEYDEVWDRMQDAKQKAKAAKEAESSVRKPKYIQNLLSSAATRKLDHLRAEEKMMQRERELEGDMYQDKETFVTQAYKDQMEEVRKAEEEERKREELRKKQGAPSIGMTHFYRQLLDENAQQHDATVAATEKRIIGPTGPEPNLTIQKPVDFTPVADAELAKIARAEGKDVELNDDNQIVDKRELLSAGLNLSLPNTRHLALRKAAALSKEDQSEAPQAHRAVGTAASRREINERRAREVQQQLADEQRRVEQTKEEAEEAARQRTVAKRNNEQAVEDARTRYLERRKRQKLEQDQAAAGASAE